MNNNRNVNYIGRQGLSRSTKSLIVNSIGSIAGLARAELYGLIFCIENL